MREKKGLSLKTASCSPLGRHWSLAKDNCLKNVCCVKLFSKEGTWKGCSKAWFSRQWFDGWSAALCQTLLVQQLDNHFTRPRPCPIVAFHFSSEQLQGVQENIARIANAVQVTLWLSDNHLNRCLCSHCSHFSQCLLVSTIVYLCLLGHSLTVSQPSKSLSL